MRKRDITLARAYLAFYILWVFIGMVTPMLLFYYNPGLMIVGISLDVISLAAVIVSHVFYNKKNTKVYIILATVGFGLMDIIILTGLILEIINTIQNKSAPYAWAMTSIGIVAMGIISAIYGNRLYRVFKPKEEA